MARSAWPPIGHFHVISLSLARVVTRRMSPSQRGRCHATTTLPTSETIQLGLTAKMVYAASTSLALNGVTAQLLMHFLNALLAELGHLAVASTSSPQPYDTLCAAMLACYRIPANLAPGKREIRKTPEGGEGGIVFFSSFLL